MPRKEQGLGELFFFFQFCSEIPFGSLTIMIKFFYAGAPTHMEISLGQPLIKGPIWVQVEALSLVWVFNLISAIGMDLIDLNTSRVLVQVLVLASTQRSDLCTPWARLKQCHPY